jgi:signal transduction histidine kinase
VIGCLVKLVRIRPESRGELGQAQSLNERNAVELANREATLTFSNTGIGIPWKNLAHVLDIFSQVRSHQARAEGGLGIGLSLVQSLIRLHSGTVSVTTAGVDKGSTFRDVGNFVERATCRGRAHR